jgi:hypothetical protein
MNRRIIFEGDLNVHEKEANYMTKLVEFSLEKL